jgi:ATP-dependent DNA helicase RecG
MTDEELSRLLFDLESDLVERKESPADGKKIRQAICAFANDVSDHRREGIIVIGVKDDGTLSGLTVTDEMLLNLSNMRSDGNILPLPDMTVEKLRVFGGEVAMIRVRPSSDPPVRYDGRVWIRVGPRRAVAGRDEERRLAEKRRHGQRPFDLQPMIGARSDDLALDFFQRSYLPAAVSPEDLSENDRSVEHQLMCCRMVSGDGSSVPTMTGVLVLGLSPESFVPGAYVQFLRIEGTDYDGPIKDEHRVGGPLPEMLRRVEEVMEAHVHTAVDFTSAPTEIAVPDYPMVALRQIFRNAVLHRDYETSNAPVRVTWYDDRVEFWNPGGPYGSVTPENFGRPGLTDYRNPTLAESMKVLGYVQKFGRGIAATRKAMSDLGSPAPEFEVEPTCVQVTLRRRP